MLDTGHYTVVVLGAGGVGKSALTVRYMEDVFIEDYNPTIEENYRRIVSVDGKTSRLEVLDTAGADQFMGITEPYITAGTGFILVFSLSQESSLQDIESLRQAIFRIKGQDAKIPIVVAGTKLDLAAEREVSHSRVQKLADEWGVSIYETSAKRNWQVTNVFEDLVRQMREIYPTPPIRKRHSKKAKCIVM